MTTSKIHTNRADVPLVPPLAVGAGLVALAFYCLGRRASSERKTGLFAPATVLVADPDGPLRPATTTNRPAQPSPAKPWIPAPMNDDEAPRDEHAPRNARNRGEREASPSEIRDTPPAAPKPWIPAPTNDDGTPQDGRGRFIEPPSILQQLKDALFGPPPGAR